MTRLIVASNRGPVSWRRDGSGGWTAAKGAGGLVVALGGALQHQPGTWVSVALDEGDREMAAAHRGSFEADTGEGTVTLRLLDVGEDFEPYYGEVANRLLWFTLHQLWAEPYAPPGRGWRDAWDAYRRVNDTVADAVIAEAGGDDDVEVHLQDYHLLTAAPRVRAALPAARILQYVHTPWVEPGYLTRLPDPVATALCEGLLACDVVGVSSPTWARHLRACLAAYTGAEPDGEALRHPGGRTVVGDFVLGIDAEGLRQVATSDAAAAEHADITRFAGGRRLLVRADRSDLSKNILRGLHAYEVLLDRHPDLRGQVAFLALVNPSRQGVAEYRAYLQACQEAADGIVERFGPAVLSFEVAGNFPRVVAAYRAYDVLLTNPVLDGTNLVAKEGPALNERDGVLVLSRTAGAAAAMGDALQVNPYDVEAQADALHTALTMPEAERARRAAGLRTASGQGAPAQWLEAQRQVLRQASRA